MFDGPKANEIDNWVCVMESSIEYEISVAQGYLSSLEIPSNILSKRDSAYSLTMGEMSLVYLYVPSEYEEDARNALKEWEESDSGEEGDEWKSDNDDHEDDQPS